MNNKPLSWIRKYKIKTLLLPLGHISFSTSHLLFADDTLLFFKANGWQANYVKQIFHVYGQATRQLLNPSKSSILFGRSCSTPDIVLVKSELGVTTSSFEEKYLDFLLLMVGWIRGNSKICKWSSLSDCSLLMGTPTQAGKGSFDKVCCSINSLF